MFVNNLKASGVSERKLLSVACLEENGKKVHFAQIKCMKSYFNACFFLNWILVIFSQKKMFKSYFLFLARKIFISITLMLTHTFYYIFT
jgi:hypothetical protein